MKTLFRILGAAAAVAATGAAIIALDKLLNQKDPLHVEAVEFPEQAEDDAEAAAETAEAYAAAQAQEAADECAAPAQEAAAQEPEASAEAPAEESAPEVSPAPPKPAGDSPIVNPVEAGPAVAPKDEKGNFDPTRIAVSEDFGDWEEQGCKG
ncbi:MAG: hypothetical protein ACI4JC_09720 [Faecalibacterium sp.]